MCVLRRRAPNPDCIVLRVRQDAFEELYERHAARLYSFLAYRTSDPALAEDLLADVFERALTTRRPLDRRRGTEAAWLFRIAVNLVHDHHRGAGREHRAYERVGRAAPTSHEDADFGNREELLEALCVLSPEEREVIALRFGADLTVPEIATALREKLTTVDGRLYRALRKLREALPDPD